MQKFIIAIAAVVFAFSTSLITPPAHAGMKGKIAVGLAIGAMAVMANQHRKAQRRAEKRRYYARKKAIQKRSYVARKKVSTPEPQYVAETVAPEDVPLPVQKVATDVASNVETENSSITTAALTDGNVNDQPIDDEPVTDNEADADSNSDEVTEVGSLGCKKFFASVGMTLSVPCEQRTAQ